MKSHANLMKSRALAGLFLSAIALCILSSSARAQLYVSQQGNNTVAEYDATTGALINSTFITGVSNPFSLALSGNNLFVAEFSGGRVGEYDATTGAAVNASFITGLSSPAAVALSGNNLFVAATEPSQWANSTPPREPAVSSSGESPAR